jgi:hypothetical protein
MTRRSPPSLPAYSCRKVEPFPIDGNLEKMIWRSCRAMTLVPATGKPQRLRPITVKACWSETHLYVGFSCQDKQIVATFTTWAAGVGS